MKNKMKIFSTFMLTMIVSILLGITIVNAESVASNVTIKSTNYNNPPMSFPQTFHVKKTSSGKYAYCITYAKKTPSSGIKYTKDDIVDDKGKYYILKEAYKNVKNNNDFFIYQTALWIYMSDKGIMNKSYSVSTFRNKVYSSNSETAKKIRTLVANAKNAPKIDTSAPTIKLSTSSNKMKLSGKNYVSSKIKLTSSTSSYKITMSGAPKGTTYKVSNGYLYVYVPASSVTKLNTSFKINVSNSKDIYKSQNYKPSNSAYQKMAVTFKETKTAKASITLTINKTVNVSVNKIDTATRTHVKGAVLEVRNSSGVIIDKWTTNGSTHVIHNLGQGTYTLKEISAPSGYNLNSTKIVFTVDGYGVVKTSNGSKISSLNLTNTKALRVIKINSENGTGLAGAKLQITNSSNKVVDSWITNGKEHIVSGLSQGSYTLSEVSAPDGYILNKESIKFTVDASGNIKNSSGHAIVKLELKNTKNLVDISKQDITTNKELPGATLELKNSSGQKVDSWVSTDKPHTIKGLKAGTYTLVETITPKGYVETKETVTFTIDKYGKLTDKNGKSIDKVIMYNTPQKEMDIEISKQDVATSKELPGATLELKDSTGKVVETWVSTDKPHVVKYIIAGTYTLSEKIAPNGYVLSTETIKFTIDKDGKLTDENGKAVDKIVMYNKQKEEKNITISKQDITTNKELPGASLTLTNSDNVIIDTWISSSDAHIIKDIEAGTYILKETKAPNGYVLSTETIKFTVDKDGKITDENGKSIDKIVMYNKPIEERNVTISKQDITTSKELPGATLELKDESGQIVDSWVSTTEAHTIKDVDAGTYTLTEKIAPDGYVLSTETIKFTIDNTGKITDSAGNVIDKVVMFNKPIPKTDVTISKQDITTSKELPGATLEVKDSNGKVIETWVSTTEAHIIKDLTEGTYTLTETQAPDGYILSTETITFKIDSTGKLLNNDGKGIEKVIMYNEKTPTPSKYPIVKQDAKTNKNIAGASLEIKDKDGKVVDSFTSTIEAHYVELEEGTYTLTETKAPNGYILNKDSITFSITSDGKIIDSNGKEISTIIVKNTPEEIITKVTISKQDVTNGKELPGAKLVVKDKNGNVIDSWTSTDKPHLIEGLTPGEYTLNEVVAPNGYVLSDETITFTVKEDGTTTSVVMYNKPESTPEIPTTPETPTTPGQEIEVENTSSWKSVIPTLIGSLSMGLGSITISKKRKKY